MKPLLSSSLGLSILLASISPASLAQWVQANGPYGGRITALAVSGNTLFAGTDGNGIYISTDAAAKWESASTGLENGRIRSLYVFSPDSSSPMIFAGTEVGVFVSSNTGGSWSQLSPMLSGHDIPALVAYIDAAGDTVIIVGTEIGMYCSTDDGRNWSGPSHEGIYSGPIMNLVVAPAVTGGKEINIFSGLALGYLFVSADNGFTWTSISAQTQGSGLTLIGASGTKIFASPTYWILKTTDAGAHWDTAAGMAIGAINCFAAAPSVNGDTVLFASGDNIGIMRSMDNGESWTKIDSGMMYHAVSTLAVVSGPSHRRMIVAGTDAGIFVSPDTGRTWSTSNTGICGCLVRALAVTDSGIFAGTLGNGLFRSTNNGATWTTDSSGISSPMILSLYESRGTMFAGAEQSFPSEPVPGFTGVFRSTDHGVHWRDVSNDWNRQQVLSFARSGSTIYLGAGAYGVFRSTDDGVSWDDGIIDWGHGAVWAMAANDSAVFAGSTLEGLFRSTNSGATWTRVNFNHNFINVLFNIGSTILAGPSDGGVYSSTDNGESWQLAGLGGAEVAAFALDGENLFAGSYSGVYFRPGGESVWNAVASNGLIASIRSLAVSGSDLWVGTQSGGAVWKRPLAEILSSVKAASDDVPGRMRLEQNYPNPFNPATTIRYGLPHRSHVVLSVYNTLGQRVAELVNDDVDTGYHEVQFDARNLASGVYFYRLLAAGLLQTRKLILAR